MDKLKIVSVLTVTINSQIGAKKSQEKMRLTSK